jgi:hypothetical protein
VYQAKTSYSSDRPKRPRYDERNTTGVEPELEHIAALHRERAKLAFVIS